MAERIQPTPAIATPESVARELNEHAESGSNHIQRSAAERSAARMILQLAGEVERLRAQLESLKAVIAAMPEREDVQPKKLHAQGRDCVSEYEWGNNEGWNAAREFVLDLLTKPLPQPQQSAANGGGNG